MPTDTARRSARSALARLVRADMDNDAFRLEAAAVLRQAIGFDWWCWTLLDPGARLPTRYLSADAAIDQAMRRFCRLTAGDGTVNPPAGVPQARSAVTALSADTG